MNAMTEHRQHTLAREMSCTGIGLHGGRPVTVRLLPAKANSGISFCRVPAAGTTPSKRSSTPAPIPAHVSGVTEVDHATTLTGRDDSIQTVEHLLAALHGTGIDNCRVEVDAGELPILDGSAAPWVFLLHEAGTRALSAPRKVLRILRPFSMSLGNASMAVYPSEKLRITCRIDFNHPSIGKMERSLVVTPRVFAEEIAPARTFGFLHEVEQLRRAGLVKGGSYSNAIVLDEHGVLSGKLRFPDEFVRHKALDLIGDLALLGLPLVGHVVAEKAGHRVHAAFVRGLLADKSCWRIEDSRPAKGQRAAAMGGVGASLFGLSSPQPLAHPE